MSTKSKLNTLKKEDLVKRILELEKEQVAVDQLKTAVAESENQETRSVVEQGQSLKEILIENKRLRDEIDRKKESDKFVFIECQSKGRVWIQSPEAKSGLPADREKGRMLNGDKDYAVIPAYWMLDIISNNNPAFSSGEVVLNNERGRYLNPNIEFVDFDLPKEWAEVNLSNSYIEGIAKKANDQIYNLVKMNLNKPFVLGRILGVINSLLEAEQDKPKELRDEGYISFLTNVSVHVDETINPNREEEFAEQQKKEEILLKTV